MNTIIFLFEVWFNPAQVVSLSPGYKPFSAPFCYINLSYGAPQGGVALIKTNYTCKITAQMINKESTDN